MSTEQTKRCGRCGETKPASAFYRNASAADGLNWRCKPCHIAAVVESNRRHPDTARKWREAHRAYAVDMTRAWRAKHPDRVREQNQRALERKGGVSRAERQARRAAILDRYVAGETLAEIGADYGITRERVRQTVANELARRKMRLVRAFRLVPIKDADADADATEGEASA